VTVKRNFTLIRNDTRNRILGIPCLLSIRRTRFPFIFHPRSVVAIGRNGQTGRIARLLGNTKGADAPKTRRPDRRETSRDCFCALYPVYAVTSFGYIGILTRRLLPRAFSAGSSSAAVTDEKSGCDGAILERATAGKSSKHAAD
jgi:hypothetical protein